MVVVNDLALKFVVFVGTYVEHELISV